MKEQDVASFRGRQFIKEQVVASFRKLQFKEQAVVSETCSYWSTFQRTVV